MAEFFAICFDDFRSAVKKFHRLLAIGLIFVVFGHFFILEPYFGYKQLKKDNEEALQQLTPQLDELQKELVKVKNTIDQIDSSLGHMKEDIQEFPAHLRSQLAQIRGLFSSPSATDPQNASIQQNKSRSIEGIMFPPGINQYEIAVNWYVKMSLQKYGDELNKEVITPVKQLEKDWNIDSKHELRELCENALKQIKEFITQLEPSFWHTYDGKEITANKLETKIGECFNPIYEKIRQSLKNIEKRKTEKELNIKLKKENIDQLNKDFDELKARINAVESPIGNIPLDFTDFISLFPLIVVIFVIILTFQLQKCKKIHILLSREVAADERNKSEEIKEYLTRCWFLPPYRKAYERILFNFSLVVVLVIFLRSSWLIIPGSISFVPGAQTSIVLTIPELFLFIAYVIGLLLVVGCLFIIGKVQRQE